MTVSVLRNQVQYTGNNSTTQFTVNFPYTEKSQVKVYLGGTLQTITTHYTLTDPDSTGTVTFVTAPGTGVIVSLIRETDFLQTVDYANNDILDAETLEAAFDKLTMMCQQVKNLADKSVGFDETVNESETTSLKLAAGTSDLAGKLLAFDDSGNFVTTQEIGTFRGNDTTTTTAAYVVRDLIRDSSNDNVYFTKVDAPSGTLLTNTTYFELLVDVETVRGLKVDAETARTGAETAETNAEAALASFQGQYKTGATNPYTGTPDQGDLWYDTSASILKYYNGSAFEPVTTSLATVTGNYLTISNQVITAGVVPVTLGGTGSTTASGARTALGLAIGSQVQAWDQQLDDISALAVTDGNIIVGNGTTWVAESGATARESLGLTIGTDVQAYDADTAKYDDTTANFTGTLQNGGSNVLVDSDIGSTVQGYDANTAKLDATTSNFTGTLQNGGSNVVVDSDIGSTVQAYDADLSTIAGLSSADGNFIVGSATGWVVESGATVRTSLGLAIGTDVQAYDADTAKYDDTTANFTGTLQNGGSNVLVDSDIGSTVQAAGSYLTSVDLTSNVTGTLPVANGGTGLTAIGTPGQVLAVNAGANALEYQTLSTGGTVTSVGVSGSDGIEVDSGSPITSSGTIALGINATSLSTHLGLGTAATTAATDYATSAQGTTADSALQDLVDDTTPQLGGNLDVNGNSIVSVSAGNISITPDTTGKIILDGLSWPTADGSADQVLQTDGAGNLSFADTTKNDVANTFTANQIISVTDNTNAALRITQTGSGNALVVEDTTNPDVTPFVITSSGQLLTGNTNAATNMASKSVLISNDNTASFSVNPGADDLVIDRESGGITIYGHTGNSAGRINFATSADDDIGSIAYFHPDNSMRFFVNASERMRIVDSGSVGINRFASTQNASSGDHGFFYNNGSGYLVLGNDGEVACILNRWTSQGNLIQFRYNGSNVGSISTNGSSLPSDRDFKKDINDLTLGLELIKKLKPKTYRYHFDEENSPFMTGFVAQDLEESLSEVGVAQNKSWILQYNENVESGNSKYELDYLKLIPILTKAIQEQQTLIQSQQSQIDALTARIEALEVN